MSDYYRGLRDVGRFDKLEYRQLGWCALVGNVECFLIEPVTRLYFAGVAAAGCYVSVPKALAKRLPLCRVGMLNRKPTEPADAIETI
jgi:hypothetical protein